MGASGLTPIKHFGSWVSRSNNTVYQASTDGIACGVAENVSYPQVRGMSDGSNPPTTIRMVTNHYGSSGAYSGGCLPVKQGHYWKITGATYVYWLPLEP